VRTQRFFIDKIGEGDGELGPERIATLQRRAGRQLNAVVNYAQWERCRRRQILEYFGEDMVGKNKVPEHCRCDVCSARNGAPGKPLVGSLGSKPELKRTGKAAAIHPNTPTKGALGTPAMEAERALGSRPSSRTNAGSDSRPPLPSARPAAEERTMGPSARVPQDARLPRLKELRRDVVRTLGTMFFQHLPDELLLDLLARPPKSLPELSEQFELHEKIVEHFGDRILAAVQAPSIPPLAARVSFWEKQTRAASLPGAEERTTRAKVSAAKEVAGGKVGAVHGPAVEARFERLRTLRLELARERGWKAFQVLHDSTLVEIARVRPRSIDELMGIPGIGKRKAEEFGKELLAELTKG
jgi:hypothetical protein